MPAACTRTNTSPDLGDGAGRSAMTRTSGAPTEFWTTARMGYLSCLGSYSAIIWIVIFSCLVCTFSIYRYPMDSDNDCGSYDAFQLTCPSHAVLEMLASKWVY